ncbi:MAG: hypothetical protein ABSH20_19645 [Tepidisphaeraceae bacterium]|jgi:hypothetical protein
MHRNLWKCRSTSEDHSGILSPGRRGTDRALAPTRGLIVACRQCRAVTFVLAALLGLPLVAQADEPADSKLREASDASVPANPAPNPLKSESPTEGKAPPASAQVGVAKDPQKERAKDPSREADTHSAGGDDLRWLLGVNPGTKRVDLPHMPAMSLRGFIKPDGAKPLALLEVAEANRVFLVQVGTEIPITVAGRIAPAGHGELSGLDDPSKTPVAVTRGGEQSQIILKVLKISEEGVVVEAGLLAQTMIIR